MCRSCLTKLVLTLFKVRYVCQNQDKMYFLELVWTPINRKKSGFLNLNFEKYTYLYTRGLKSVHLNFRVKRGEICSSYIQVQ